jgi:hypothetical protein
MKLKVPALIDAQLMHRQNPKTFWAPDREILALIEKGDHVRISTGDERFWVQVEDIDGETVTGRVDNELLFTETHHLKLNDRVIFDKRCVYAVQRF